MQQATTKKLITLTNQFYSQHAKSFSATRQIAWEGWNNLIAFFQLQNPSILDIGCGNGRFLQFIRDQQIHCSYQGVDNNPELIAQAKLMTPNKTIRFIEHDVLNYFLNTHTILPNLNNFTVISIFGLVHHIPGKANRLAFIKAALAHLLPSGYLIVSFWQPLNNPDRFTKKQLNPIQFKLNPDELEDGDLLLGWGTNSDSARYCHSFTNQEIDWYIHQISQQLKLVKRFQADGKTNNLNQYVVWQKIQVPLIEDSKCTN